MVEIAYLRLPLRFHYAKSLYPGEIFEEIFGLCGIYSPSVDSIRS